MSTRRTLATIGSKIVRFSVCVTAVAVLVGAATPTGALAVADKAIWGPAIRDGASLFPTYQDLGTKIYEDRLYWSSVGNRRPKDPTNPNDPAYVWPAEVTEAVAEAQRYHMRVALQIIGAPTWANGDKPWNWAPKNPQDYANFAIAASRRYPSVHLWMIWGEPTRSENFEPLDPAKQFTKLTGHQLTAPHRYAQILDDAYGALKSVTRSNVVIGGMTFSGGNVSTQQWLENLRLPNGRPPRLDLYGHNPFIASEPNLSAPPTIEQSIGFSDIARLKTMVDRNLGTASNPHPELFLSEWTIPTRPDEEFGYWVEPALQARWITAGLRIAQHLPGVYAVGWIHLYDEPPTTYGGLIEADGTRKPGYFAWKNG